MYSVLCDFDTLRVVFFLGNLREMGLERPFKKHAGGMFLGRGRVPQILDASCRDVDKI